MDSVKTDKLLGYLEMMRNPKHWSKDVCSDITWAFNDIACWVEAETKDHKCIECGKTIPAGVHRDLCSGECEVLYA